MVLFFLNEPINGSYESVTPYYTILKKKDHDNDNGMAKAAIKYRLIISIPPKQLEWGISVYRTRDKQRIFRGN